MATYMSYMKLTNGQMLYNYYASSVAVGVDLPGDTGSVATATSPTSFRVKSRCAIADFICTETAGSFQIYEDGVPTGTFVNTTAAYAGTAIRTPIILTFGAFQPGKEYRFRMVEAGAA